MAEAMELGLKGKVALVTGGSRGIGRACVVALAREGAHVTFSYASNAKAAEETIEAVKAVGGEAEAMQFDVQDAAACKQAVDSIVKKHGGLHVLVNNAGVSIDGLIMRFKDEDLTRSFQTNVFGPFYLARAAARPMMKARWGRIIMLGSVVGEMGNVGQAAYAATKAALDGMSKSLAKELGSRGVTANVIAPGFIETDMTKSMSEDMMKALLSSIPSGEMGRGDDIANAVLYLASDAGRYVTGHVLNVNGGLYM
ncbi:MAG: 3-oxoacyl-ACP reductase family protein [Myxococcota bacterium]